jgi:ubiquinol-cytochrome c reductase cytochrome b subunit
VIALVLSILILIILPFTNIYKFRTRQFYPINKILFWCFISIASLLTWIGARPVEEPFIIIGQLLTVLYFAHFMLVPLSRKFWDKKI